MKKKLLFYRVAHQLKKYLNFQIKKIFLKLDILGLYINQEA